jgi:hypothetical protein
MKMQGIQKRSTVFIAIVAIVALFVVTLTQASQQASAVVVHHKVAVHHKAHAAPSQASATAVVVHHKVAVHHKAHTVSKVHHKVIAVIPQMHGEPITALKKLVKGPQ